MANAEVDVNRASLLPQARQWDTQARTMFNIAGEAIGLTCSHDAGVLEFFIATYNQACTEVWRLCNQGCLQMDLIGNALVTAHQNYDDAEQANIDAIKQI
jgi:hypothetical protein